MSFDPTISGTKDIEAALRKLAPSPLDATALDRLEAAAEGIFLSLSPAEAALERELAAHRPMSLSPEFLARLEENVALAPFPVDEKIVLFPKGAQGTSSRAPHRGNSRRSFFSAAAAVAILGASAALLIPRAGETPREVVAHPAPIFTAEPAVAHASNSRFTPVGFNRGVSNTRDAGVLWQSKTRPQRIVVVEYVDRLTLKDAQGKTIEVEQPRTEYILVPDKAD